jgi:transaldolase
MPGATLEAVWDHGPTMRATITGNISEAEMVFAALQAAGIDFDAVTQLLEEQAVSNFKESWMDLLDQVTRMML